MKKLQVIEGRKQSADWRDKPCELTLGEISDHTDAIRSLGILLHMISAGCNDRCKDQSLYSHLTEEMDRELSVVCARFPHLFTEDKSNWDTCSRLIRCISLLPATRENHEFLLTWRERFLVRWNEVKQPHLVVGFAKSEKEPANVAE